MNVIYKKSTKKTNLVSSSFVIWEQGRRLNPLLHIMSVLSYHILYPAIKFILSKHYTYFLSKVNNYFQKS